MKQFTIIMTIFILLFSQKTFACDCDYEGEFLKVALKSEFIALVKVKKHLTYKNIYDKKTPMSMEVEIIEVYKGSETRKTIVVWGDNGHLCRPYLSLFEINKYYVNAFFKGSDGSQGFVHKNEKTTDYSISNCGDYWLKADIKKQNANGSVTKKQTQIKLADIKTKLFTK